MLLLNYNLISDISLLSDLTNLGLLTLDNNSISGISPLSGLTSLGSLHLDNNSIHDISALSELTSLTKHPATPFLYSVALDLSDNPNLTAIQPLLNNTGLAGVLVSFINTSVSCTDVAALEAKGVLVYSDCP